MCKVARATVFILHPPHMKLNQDTIDGLQERSERMRSPNKLYAYMWVMGWHQLKIVFDGFLKQLVLSGAFERRWSHYKLNDISKLNMFKKKI